MTTFNKTVVLKFGSSVLSSTDALPDVVTEIYRWYRKGYRVVPVVSAIGSTTDALLDAARAFGTNPCERSSAMLLGTGEIASAALLGLALHEVGVPANVLDHRRISLRTGGSATDATPATVDVAAINGALADAPVLVLPGFLGVDDHGCTTLLGRGGSDLTAIFVAQQINADRCRLIKDVDGLYEADPNAPGARPSRFTSITFDDAAQLNGKILQRKATEFARDVSWPFEVTCLHERAATLVGSDETVVEDPPVPTRPIRVALLGLGTVGRGVYERVVSRPDLFELSAVAVRSRRGAERSDVPADLLTTDCWRAIRSRPDVMIELIGGVEPAVELIEGALARGIHVISANKAVLARHSAALERIADAHNVTLRGAASVGGSAPIVEHVQQLANGRRITLIEGIINGSTNVILDDLIDGRSLEDSVERAQRDGFCEADPSRDLNGIDAADKLAILARLALGVSLDPDQISRVALDQQQAIEANRCGRAGRSVRHIARAIRAGDGVQASVRPLIVGPAHPLAHVRREWNALAVETDDGARHIIRGRGAGRIPTTESVLADLFALRRESLGHVERFTTTTTQHH